MRTREEFHNLIEEIKDEKALKGYFELIKRLNENHTGELWDALSQAEKEELLLAYEESLDSKSLIDHETVKHQHGKWLER